MGGWGRKQVSKIGGEEEARKAVARVTGRWPYFCLLERLVCAYCHSVDVNVADTLWMHIEGVTPLLEGDQ